MTKSHYSNAVEATLEDYAIIPSRFRTVLASQRKIPSGLSEIPVELELQKKFIDTLSFEVQWDGLMYGYIRRRADVEQKTGGVIKKVIIADWDDKFVAVFEQVGGEERPVLYLTPGDVRHLLENCLRVPEQR